MEAWQFSKYMDPSWNPITVAFKKIKLNNEDKNIYEYDENNNLITIIKNENLNK